MSFIKSIASTIRKNRTFRRFYYSFSFRLLLLDAKKNIPLLLFWVFVFAILTGNFANKYGVPFLFLGPEYFNEISVLSYFIIGFSVGGFVIAYNISSFIRHADRFPFLASLHYPFMKYCINNFTIPITFIVLYCYRIFFFLQDEAILSTNDIYLMILAFLSGITIFLTLAFTYFYGVNKDIFQIYGVQHKSAISYKLGRHTITGERDPSLVTESRDWYVETYFNSPTRVRLVRSVQHYKKEMLKEVIIRKNHSAFIFQMFSIVSLLALGFLSEIRFFELPAGASIFLLLTTFMMVFSSMYRWFSGWTIPVVIMAFFVLNYIHKFNLLAVDRVYGLNYNTEKADYSLENFKKIDGRYDLLSKDIKNTEEILEKWKAKNTSKENPEKKPKIILINTSGGGLRSSLWTFYTLTHVDSLAKGKLLAQTQLITGSSGGMVGAGYLRELYLRKQNNQIESYYDEQYLKNISKDLLNPIAFKIATSEWFIPMQHFTIDGNTHPKDRAYAFEYGLEENIENVLNKRLSDYKKPESESQIPMMVFSPSIVNDGRKLLVSPQGISYLTQNPQTPNTIYEKLYDDVEYSKFFEKQSAGNTLFTSVLRMSATFPYISPSAVLPCEPEVEVIDAGYRDNYGLESSLRFIRAFNDWIAENTSGVVIIQLRDKPKTASIQPSAPQSFLQALSKPMGSFYSNLFNVQDFNQNRQIQGVDLWSKSTIEFIDLELNNAPGDRISLNWHLTNQEKRKVFASLNTEKNQLAIQRIVELLK